MSFFSRQQEYGNATLAQITVHQLNYFLKTIILLLNTVFDLDTNLPEDVEQLRDKRSKIKHGNFHSTFMNNSKSPSFLATNQGQLPTVGRRSRIVLPAVPFTAEYLEKSRMIFHAHQLLFGSLFEYFKGISNAPATEDLNNVLNQFKNNYAQYFNLNTAPINLRDRFYQIYHQRNEVCHQSYSIECFDLDKEVLLEVATYLAGQTTVSNRNSLVQSVTNALNYHGPSVRSFGINCARYSSDSHGISRRAERTTRRPFGRSTRSFSLSRLQLQMA